MFFNIIFNGTKYYIIINGTKYYIIIIYTISRPLL